MRDSICTGRKCHGRRFLSLGKILQTDLSMILVLDKMSTAKFPSITNSICSFQSLIYMNNRIVPSGNTGLLTAVRRQRICCYLIFDGHSHFRESLLRRSSPEVVSNRRVCGWSHCESKPISMAAFYFDIGGSVTVVCSS